MERLSMTGLIVTSAILTATGALAQDANRQMPFMAQMGRAFGASGLLAELGQEESYGAVQSRIAQSRAGIAAANATHVTSGYADDGSSFSLPVTMSFSLPDAGVRVRGTLLNGSAEENRTYASSGGYSGLVEYMTMPTERTMLGYGLFFGDTDVDLEHNGGTIDAPNYGLRVDLLQTLSDHWGLAGRVFYRKNQTETTIPLGATELVTDQGSDTVYTEWTLVGTYDHEDLALVPEGWDLRPRLRALYSRTSSETVRNSLGGTVSGTEDEYASIQAKLRLFQPVFRPDQGGFYYEGGFEHEVLNDLNAVVDDPDIILGKVGYARNLQDGMFVDVSWGVEHGTQGLRHNEALTLVLSKTF